MHIDAIPPDEMPSDRVLGSLFNEQVRTHAGFAEYCRLYDVIGARHKNKNYRFLKKLARQYVARLREDDIMRQTDRNFALPLVDGDMAYPSV